METCRTLIYLVFISKICSAFQMLMEKICQVFCGWIFGSRKVRFLLEMSRSSGKSRPQGLNLGLDNRNKRLYSKNRPPLHILWLNEMYWNHYLRIITTPENKLCYHCKNSYKSNCRLIKKLFPHLSKHKKWVHRTNNKEKSNS